MMGALRALLLIAIFGMLLAAGCVKEGQAVSGQKQPAGASANASSSSAEMQAATGMKAFSSWDEVSEFLLSANPSSGYAYFGPMVRNGMALDVSGEAKQQGAVAGAPTMPSGAHAPEYSATNVQVEGVDEADIVKTDGKYIYVVGNDYGYYGIGPFSFSSNRGEVRIIEAYPPSGMKVVGKVSFEGSADEIFAYNGKLVVFGSRYDSVRYPYPAADARAMCARCIVPPYYSQNFAFMKVYDITDRSAPKLEKEYEVKGSYVTSRMVGGRVYGVFSDPANYADPVPLYAVDGVVKKIGPDEVFYFDWPDSGYSYNIFLSADLDNLSKEETRKVLLMGYAQNLFVSQENMFVTYTAYGRYYPEWKAFSDAYGDYIPQEAKEKIAAIEASDYPEWRKDRMKMAEISAYAQEIARAAGPARLEELQKAYLDRLSALQLERAREAEKTSITRLSLADFSVTGKAEVPGRVLNQFSMDEYNGYFRIATTSPQVGGWGAQGNAPSSSNLYVLDPSFKEIGKVEGIAPGEQIYSVRFMGNRAYMVTFRQIDPFFALDLSDPSAPKIAGKLKLPGYSDYLHPYDENHIIGLGKEVQEGKEGETAWQKGMKLSLFDVSDTANPKEVAKYEIGDRGTDSYALHDHKAFLFSKTKGGLLVIPVLEARLDPSKYAGGETPPWQYGDYVFQGAYVFSVSPDSGFQLRGKVTHATEEELLKSGEYYWSAAQVSRSLYMGDVLYTVSDRYVKANDLSTLAPISSVQIGKAQQQG